MARIIAEAAKISGLFSQPLLSCRILSRVAEMRPTPADVIGGLYEAAADGCLWDQSWKAVLDMLEAATGMLFIDLKTPNNCDFLSMSGWTEAASRDYMSHYMRVDPYVLYGKTAVPPSTGAHLGTQIISARDYEETEIWQDFGRSRTNAFHFIVAQASIPGVGSAKIGLHRPRDQSPFDEEERQTVEALLPYLQAALRLRTRLLKERSVHQAKVAALDALTQAIVILDGNYLVLTANRAAEELARSGLLSFGPRGFSTIDSQANSVLRKLINAVWAGRPGGSTLIRRGAELLCASVERAPHGMTRPAGVTHSPIGHHVVVFINHVSITTDIARRRASELYNLTPAEAEVYYLLGQGHSPIDIANDRRVSINTVRTQVRQILGKTGCSNLRELTRLLARLSA